MFTKFKIEKEGLHKLIDQLQTRMLDETLTPQEYAILTDQLTKLYATKTSSKWIPSTDVLATVFGNLAGIGIIVGHEKLHVVTSKAIGFVLKAR